MSWPPITVTNWWHRLAMTLAELLSHFQRTYQQPSAILPRLLLKVAQVAPGDMTKPIHWLLSPTLPNPKMADAWMSSLSVGRTFLGYGAIIQEVLLLRVIPSLVCLIRL